MLESVIQAQFIRQVKLRGLGLAMKVDSTSRRGFPDVVYIDNTGETVYIEFKADSGKLSPHQIKLHDEMILLGANVMVITGEQGLNRLLTSLKNQA